MLSKKFICLILALNLLLLTTCAPPDRERRRGANQTASEADQPGSEPASALIEIEVDPAVVQRSITRQLFGQGVWYSWQAYAWDGQRQQTYPQAMQLFQRLEMGLLGHYPGVGVITHDFHWKNLIGPLNERTDPTPRQTSFDTPQSLEFGPDEYGRFLEEYRLATGISVEGSIQINIVNGTAQEAADWVEYMNGPNDGSNPGGGTDWAAVRAANGHPDPYYIRYWELGNEPHFTASEIGHLTVQEYVANIQAFVPLMKERDPSIEVMAYVNPFEIGSPDNVGVATADLRVAPDLTWSQAVIRDAGEHLDYLYFHWFGGWNDRRQGYEFLATSMHTGLVPLLDRLAQDVETFAPSPAARDRLRRVFIPEWNVYGGWFKPMLRGTSLQGAIIHARTLHIFASRPEIQGAQHLALLAPYPDPPVTPRPVDIREGYFTFRGQADESDFMGTALAAVAELWARAFAPNVVFSTITYPPALAASTTFANGTPVLDVTAMSTADGKSLRIILTNASPEVFSARLRLTNFIPQSDAVHLSVTSRRLADNNSWRNKDKITVVESSTSLAEGDFILTIPAYSVEAWLLSNEQLSMSN